MNNLLMLLELVVCFTHIENIRPVIETTRKYSADSKIILGGAIASGDPEFIMDELQPDYLVIGEGEVTMDYLLQAIKNNSNMHNVTGIFFKENNSYVKTPPTPLIENLDLLPYPDYEGFEFEYYLNNYKPKEQHLSAVRGTFDRRMAFIISRVGIVSQSVLFVLELWVGALEPFL